MYFHLNISNYTTMTLAFAAVPDGVTSLDLSMNHFGNSITGAELIQAFEAIPKSVTSLDLSMNHFSTKLVEAFKAIPEGVTLLDLSANKLDALTGDRLAWVFAAIPKGVTSLNLSRNNLFQKTGAELVAVSATSLDLNLNYLFDYNPAIALATAFNSIPKGVTSLNLSRNGIAKMSAVKLRSFIQVIPPHVTSINLHGNDLFRKKSPEKIDIFLNELGDVRARLDLRDNGESEFARAVGPLVQMDISGVPGRKETLTITPGVTAKIASFLVGRSEHSLFKSIDKHAKTIGTKQEARLQMAGFLGVVP